LENDVTAPDARFHLGRLYVWTGDFERAARAFSRYVSGDGALRIGGPMRGDRLLEQVGRARSVALAYELNGQASRAVSVLDDMLREHPQLGQLYVHKARLLLGSRDVLGAMDALEAMVRSRTVDPVDDATMEEVLQLVAGLGRERETLDVLRRTAPDARSFPLGVALVDLALRMGDTELARAEVARLLEQSNLGSVRYRLAMSYFETRDFDAAGKLLLEVLEPGRGLGRADNALETLLIIARQQGDGALLAEVGVRVSRLFEDRGKFHQAMAGALVKSGHLDEAVDHVNSWLASVGTPPTGTGFFNSRAHPWRLLILVHLRRSDESAVLTAAEEYVRQADNPRAARRATALFLSEYQARDLAYRLFEKVV
jgi:tetratricopeptide (TPR) repeat protein